MAQKNPLVLQNGRLSQLPPGGTISGYSLGTLVAGSGLVGGGDLSTGNKTVQAALATNPSGLVFAGTSIGYDGVAQVTAWRALASGNAALSAYPSAAASGAAAQVYADTALSSGNAALTAAVNASLYSNAVSLTASSTISGGSPVGVDSTGRVSSLTVLSSGNTNPPSYGTPDILLSNYTSVINVDCVYDNSTNKVYQLIANNNASRRSYVYQTEVTNNQLLYNTTSGVVGSGATTDMAIAVAPNAGYLATFGDDTLRTNFTYLEVATYSGNDYVWNVTNNANNILGGTNTALHRLLYLPNSDTFLGAYISGNPTGRGFVCPAKIVDSRVVRGISSGFAYTNNVNALQWDMAYNHVQDKVGFFYNNTTTAAYGTLGTLSGDVVSIGPETQFDTRVNYISSAYSPVDDKFIVTYQDFFSATVLSGTAVLASISGNSLEYSQPWGFASRVGWTTTTYDPYSNKIVFGYQDVNNSSYGTAIVGEISGNVINYGTPSVFSSTNVTNLRSTVDTQHNSVCFIYFNTTNSRIDTVVFDHLSQYSYYPALSGVSNYLGIAQSTVSSGSPVTVLLPKSIDYNQTNLQVGRDYYLDHVSGGLTTYSGIPPAWSGGTWSPVGRAVSSSGLYLLRSL